MATATDCGVHRVGSRADVDDSAWDGAAAMSTCAGSDTSATCYGSICAGRRAGDASKQSSWALPHHKTAGGAPNAAGVRNALARLPQTQGLTNKTAAQAHLDAHMSAISPDSDQDDSKSAAKQPPKENLVRGIWPVELRDTAGTEMPTLTGHFAVFNEWTEIDSLWEGNFLESIAPGAFRKTFAENRSAMRVLFQHGRDPMVGDKPLGRIDTLEEDDTGARYEVPLMATSYNADLLPGLREGLYGASFRFRVMKEEVDKTPEASEFNPRALPQRTIREAQVMEFGPVTFPAYPGATAGVRSLTDEFILSQLFSDQERLSRFLERYLEQHAHHAPALGGEPASATPVAPSRPEVRRPLSQAEFLAALEH